MKLFYVTLNNEQEAKTISQHLLEKKFAVCTNWFPIQCMYRQGDDIKHGNEWVLIIKTQSGYKEKIDALVAEHIDYTNCIIELCADAINQSFIDWLDKEVPN